MRTTWFLRQMGSEEAYLKGRGMGLALSPDRFTIELDDNGQPLPLGNWRFALHRPSPRHVAAAAIRRHSPRRSGFLQLVCGRRSTRSLHRRRMTMDPKPAAAQVIRHAPDRPPDNKTASKDFGGRARNDRTIASSADRIQDDRGYRSSRCNSAKRGPQQVRQQIAIRFDALVIDQSMRRMPSSRSCRFRMQ